LVTLTDIREAQARLRGVALHTPLIESQIHQSAGTAGDRKLYLKPENLQPIGAFKLRGAYNKIASLSPEERAAVSSLTPAAIMGRALPTPRGRWARRPSS
jgi:threonine dehydratase